jgi:hypothetical protein
MAGFCESAISLRAPKLAPTGAKSPKVSGRYLKYSRFRETAVGDRVRSALPGRACSVTSQILRLGRRQIGRTGLGVSFSPIGLSDIESSDCRLGAARE